MNVKLTPEKKTAFLAVLSQTANVSAAAEAIGVARQTVYQWRENDSEFASAWAKAEMLGVEGMKDEVNRRAFAGFDEPVFYQGAMCGSVRKYSDTLAMFLIKARDPAYRDNSKVELSGRLALNEMSDEDIRAELSAIAASGLLKTDDGSIEAG
ncbi:terminase [Caballeronia sp. AZ10_KS36]|uniref:terminase n=1 Tax=Caballeronia sp. AZ10_KS36 TaxID=2921757 RepID=UPI002028EB1C|nr:terminase [Caballeronia sp. AZ10_KS36]